MSEDIVISDSLVIPAAELTFSAARASGPGGQHVNTTDTRVQLRWNVRESSVLTPGQKDRLGIVLASRINRRGELVLTCGTRRSQHRNRREVAARLAKLVGRALAPRKPRRPTRPTRTARERRLRQKRRRAELKRGRRTPSDS